MSDDLVKRLREEATADTSTCSFLTEEAADRIEKLEAQLAQSQLKRWAARWEEQSDRIKKLEGTLLKIKDLHHQLGPEDEQVIEIRDDMTYCIVCDALEGKYD